MDGRQIVLLAIRRPAIELAEDVQREAIDVLRRDVPPLAHAAGAQVRRHMHGEIPRRRLPAEPQGGAQHGQQSDRGT
ncbi:hypothetical protein D3C85_1607270 [compost metagenome]